MITRRNIAEFYRRYRDNLEKGMRLQDVVRNAKDQEVWVENLRERSEMMRSLYVENEAMLNLYLRPILKGAVTLTEELADELLKQILEYQKAGFQDAVVCMEVAELLRSYYAKRNQSNWMEVLRLLGRAYNSHGGDEYGKRAYECFDELRQEMVHYEDFESRKMREIVLDSYFNCCAVVMNWWPLAEKKQAVRELERALAVYTNEKVRERDGDWYDFDESIRSLKYIVYGNWVCSVDQVDEIEEPYREQIWNVLQELYEDAVRENPNEHEMEWQIYANYFRGEYFQNKISLQEYADKSLDYCEYVWNHHTLMEDPENFYVGLYFDVTLYFMPNILGYYANPENHLRDQDARRAYMEQRLMAFFEELPRYQDATYVNGAIIDNLPWLLKIVREENADFSFIMNVLVSRNETILLHAVQVCQLSSMLLRAVFEKCPELLVSSLETTSVVEVLEKRQEFEAFVAEASMIFDIRKARYAAVMDKQDRKLCESEMNQLRQHTEEGYKLACLSERLHPYADIIRGHHRSYDGKSGYPEAFDNTASPDRFFIDLIRICDCLDAGTDAIGHVYCKTKDFDEVLEELTEGAGTQYHPELVQLILENEPLREAMKYQCGAGRLRTYYETYQTYMQDVPERPEHSELPESIADAMEREAQAEKIKVLQSLEKTAMLILYVDLLKDEYQVVYCGERTKSECFSNVTDGSFSSFLMSDLRKIVNPSDWVQLEQLTGVQSLSNRIYEADGLLEKTVRIREGAQERWVRVQFLEAEESQTVLHKITVCIQDVDQQERQREQLLDAVKLASAQAREASQAKSRFLSSMSHDIRTPLNAIVGMTQIARMHLPEQGKVEECLEKIEVASGHLLRLVEEVLDMSRIESGRMELSEERIDLKERLHTMYDMTEQAAEKKRMNRILDLSGLEQECVIGDGGRLLQIFLNLMTNAIKYTPEGGNITFRAWSERAIGAKQRYRFCCEDDGIGMSSEFQKTVFEAFQREYRPQTEQVEGTGLGLSIASRLVHLMDGEITVKSEVGKGSRFDVTVLLKTEQQTSAQKIETMQEVKPSITEREAKRKALDIQYAGQRVLVAEDNELNWEILRELLVSVNLQAEHTANGQEAIDLLLSHPADYYRLIFMDVQMPILDGNAATAQIRGLTGVNRVYQSIPIIALSANLFREDKELAYKSGVNGYLGKPIDLVELRKVLDRWI